MFFSQKTGRGRIRDATVQLSGVELGGQTLAVVTPVSDENDISMRGSFRIQTAMHSRITVLYRFAHDYTWNCRSYTHVQLSENIFDADVIYCKQKLRKFETVELVKSWCNRWRRIDRWTEVLLCYTTLLYVETEL